MCTVESSVYIVIKFLNICNIYTLMGISKDLKWSTITNSY